MDLYIVLENCDGKAYLCMELHGLMVWLHNHYNSYTYLFKATIKDSTFFQTEKYNINSPGV